MSNDTGTPPPDTRAYADLFRRRVITANAGTITADDIGVVVECSFAGAVALTIEPMQDGANFIIQKTGAATDVTVTPQAGGVIDGAANLRIGGAAGIGSAPFRRGASDLFWFSA